MQRPEFRESFNDPDVEREFGVLGDERPNSDALARLEERLRARWRPVRPLPSDGALLAMCVFGFAVLAALGTIPTGFFGLHALTMGQMTVLYGAVLASASLVAWALARQMIPGAPARLAPWLVVTIPLVVLAIVVPLVFPHPGFAHFVEQGYPCLRLGTLAAIPGGVFSWALLSRGWITDPTPAALLGGAFSGWVGIGVLSLHCPILNSFHILFWHLPVIVVAALAGALAGELMGALASLRGRASVGA